MGARTAIWSLTAGIAGFAIMLWLSSGDLAWSSGTGVGEALLVGFLISKQIALR
jgi:hypothetical protein